MRDTHDQIVTCTQHEQNEIERNIHEYLPRARTRASKQGNPLFPFFLFSIVSPRHLMNCVPWRDRITWVIIWARRRQ